MKNNQFKFSGKYNDLKHVNNLKILLSPANITLILVKDIIKINKNIFNY